MMQRAIGVLVALVVIVWIVKNPAQAGDDVHGWVTNAFTFVQHLGGS